MAYELVLNYYKSFCTKITNLSNYFGDDSTFIFIGDFDQTFIAFGKHEIKRHIEEEFWSTNTSKCDKTLFAYNINLEKKTHKVNPKPSEVLGTEEVIAVSGTISAIRSEEDIQLTRVMGRKFCQTFLMNLNKNECYFKTSVMSYLSPTTDCLDHLIRQELRAPTPSVADNRFDCRQSQAINDLEFKKIVKTIDDLINENKISDECPLEMTSDSRNNDLMPISVNEILDLDSNIL